MSKQQIELNTHKAIKPYVENQKPTKEGLPTIFKATKCLVPQSYGVSLPQP